jgi:hypothetical protein
MTNETTHSEEEEKEFELKILSGEGVTAAVAKAEKYRLLNDPTMAESICLDILNVEPDNAKTKIIMLLALTDQFGMSRSSHATKKAKLLVSDFKDDFLRIYYSGLINERLGTATLNSSTMGREHNAYEWYIDAMELYAEAENLQPAGDNDSILRWNTCARIIMQHKLTRRPIDDTVTLLE